MYVILWDHELPGITTTSAADKLCLFALCGCLSLLTSLRDAHSYDDRHSHKLSSHALKDATHYAEVRETLFLLSCKLTVVRILRVRVKPRFPTSISTVLHRFPMGASKPAIRKHTGAAKPGRSKSERCFGNCASLSAVLHINGLFLVPLG